ncbi:MAG: Peptidoglycan glycosyltransferase [Candidatus Roizmanbacteria bacterium GW2011_GWA2_33_33]|uniref:Peptidoglycan glycosyltransferase n=2 Tax=Candidatus Roizmaniibacteriota TaxID=1752723 RepID=A0A0G0BGK3_9BACT|nr:MAG: Peptidoglycan glycosyltransferase [Candidatus Roizmanbacteria bacterium GW2011_GWA2_33_33]KKP62781.1 MAG: Peptidoglycan glycosyltransferase [Candidatus Roizmanbacteria bacterium GW2011_GWC2_34_23]
MKIKFIFLLFIAFYLAIIVRLFFLQVIYSPLNKSEYLKTNKLYPVRGRIYDLKNQSLVLNQNSYQLYIEPKKIADKDKLLQLLSKSLEVEEASISAKLNMSKNWVAIFAGITQEQKDKIDKLNLKGIGFDYQTKRFYPEASLSAHLLGFLGKDNQGEDVGYLGLEGFYNRDLRGLPGFLETERDILGRPILIGVQQRVEAENGRDLVLTIDKNVQEISKKRLLEGLDKYKAKKGCVITADPKTMAILSLVCLPDYDLEKYYLFNENFYKNLAISDLYEPGSVFKPLIVAAALEEKKIKPNDIYNETGQVAVGEYNIKTWNDKYEGRISMTRILEKSSNVGMVYIGEKLGNKKIYSYLEKFGFGQNTDIDLEGEASGYLKPANNWYPIDYATVTFGQGIAITPIQLIRAFASIINGGYLMKPYVVQKIVSENKVTEIKPKIEKRVISQMTSNIIKKMLVSTVENAEAKWDRPKGFSIGGKTGTAQVPIKGIYDTSKTIASFIGFAPAENPKFLTFVVLYEPKTSQWGSETAAPLFFEIVKDLIVYYNISPTQ